MSHRYNRHKNFRSHLTDLVRYLFNPCVEGHLDSTAATLNLANCCIWYLCQNHHDDGISDDEIAKYIISGKYRLHNYAVTTWLDLVERYVSLNGSKPLSSELIHALEYLATERFNGEFTASTDLAGRSQKPGLKKFKAEWPKLHTMLLNVARFHWRCSTFEYHISKGEMSKPGQLLLLNLTRKSMDRLCPSYNLSYIYIHLHAIRRIIMQKKIA